MSNLIGGALVDAVGGERSSVSNPATGAVIGSVPRGDELDAQRAVVAAATAFRQWRHSLPKERAALLLCMADILESHLDEFVEIESSNAGKPMLACRQEISDDVDILRFFAGCARQLPGLATGVYARGLQSSIMREPLGVCAGIVPWNYPLQMAIMKFAPAIAAGNTSIIKPSDQTPLSAVRFAELVAKVVPPGVLNVITGPGRTVGRALAEARDVALVSLTGDTSTGKKIAKSAADSLKRVHLELGGKAPMIVLADMEIDAAVAGVRAGSFFNAGQDCTAVTRMLVHESRFDDMVGALVPALESLVIGDPAEGDHVELGPLVSAAQQKRVLEMIARAKTEGAEVVTGGEAFGNVGAFVRPTLIVGVDQKSEIVQEEVFGPVLTVQTYSDEVEAVHLANDVRYGLAASVWGRALDPVNRIVPQLDFGVVWVNDHLPFTPEMPHGGFKESGYGKDLSPFGFEEYTRVKHVMMRVSG